MSTIDSRVTGHVGLASATSANGTARNGATIDMNGVHPGTLSARCVGSLDTSSVVATTSGRGSLDGTTFFDLRSGGEATTVNNTAFTTAAGTGSTVAHDRGFVAPYAICAFPYARVVATLSGAATASADVTAVTYCYLQYKRRGF